MCKRVCQGVWEGYRLEVSNVSRYQSIISVVTQVGDDVSVRKSARVDVGPVNGKRRACAYVCKCA